MKKLKNIDLTSPLFLSIFLILFHLISRLYIWLNLPERSVYLSKFATDYSNALRHHFLTYLFNTTLLPPVNYIKDAIVRWIFPDAVIFNNYINYLLTAILWAIMINLLFRAGLKAQCQKWIAFIVAILFSLILIPLEFWHFSAHYDYLTIFLNALFVYSLVSFFINCTNRNVLLLSIFSTILILQSSVNTYIVPPTIFVCFLLIQNKFESKKVMFRRFFLAIIIPIAAILLLCFKNYMISGIFTSSNKGGAVINMVTNKIFNRWDPRTSPDEMRAFFVEQDAPEWYLHCFDHPHPRVYADGKISTVHILSAKAFGICYPWRAVEENDKGDDYIKFDLLPLYLYLKNNGFEKQAHYVWLDIEDTIKRPYLYAGFDPSLSPRWIGIYGQVSMRMAVKALLKYPRHYLNIAIKQHHPIYASNNPSFLNQRINTYLSNHSLLFQKPVSKIASAATPFFQFFYKLNYVLMPLSLLIILIAKLCNVPSKAYPFFFSRLKLFIIIGSPIALNAVMFCMGSGSEHERYFIQSFPMITFISVILLSAPFQWKNFLNKV